MRKIILAGILILAYATASAYGQTIFGPVPDPREQKKHVFFSFGFDAATPVNVVNIPPLERVVFTHLDDTDARSRIPRFIPYPNSRTAYDNRLYFSLGGDYWFGDYFQLRYGGTIAYLVDLDKNHPGNENIREWGQFVNNDNRGSGESLVYYRIVGPKYVPGMFVEYNAKLFSGFPRLIIGYAGNLNSLNFQTGWDRSDELEINETKSMEGKRGRTWSHRPYFGLSIPLFSDKTRVGSIRFTIGKLFRPQIQFGDAMLTKTSTTAFRIEFDMSMPGRE